MSNKKILFVVAHPDDESLWIGGTLNFLSQLEGVDVSVLCMTGGLDPARSSSFREVMRKLNIQSWHHFKNDLVRVGGVLISSPEKIIKEGLENLGSIGYDLIITHSFYGDEHLHIQHKQLYNVVREYCSKESVPFSYFSFMTIPYFAMIPCQRAARRFDKTHLVNDVFCQQLSGIEYNNLTIPHKYYQYKVDSELKDSLLQCYTSIDLEEHQRGYYAWDSCIEGFYTESSVASEIFDEINNKFGIPAEANCF
jgi:LmbE family N-acetylglucosaminyl deacetylase